jgi:hypothetical protein
MNPLYPKMVTGTVGELFVQLRLLQYSVQAAPPIRDTGNDLIAVKGSVLKAIQIKTTSGQIRSKHLRLRRAFHVLAVVIIKVENHEFRLDESDIFIFDRNDITTRRYDLSSLHQYKLNQRIIDKIFQHRKKDRGMTR